MRIRGIRAVSLICFVSTLGLLPAAAAPADDPPANTLLLSADGSGGLRRTTTEVKVDRFVAAPGITTAVTDVKFTVGTERTDVAVSDTIPAPLDMQRNGVAWYEQNLLISGIGFAQTDVFPQSGTYPYGKATGQSRYLNVRVMWPQRAWNGRLLFWNHGLIDNQVWMFTPGVEPELLLRRGWAVAEAQFSGPVPVQQNPYAADASFWKSVDEMYLQDPTAYSLYPAHPDWWSNPNGEALGDGATLRNITNLVKNLLFRETGRQPARSYWLGWSAGGPAGAAMNTGRDVLGNYMGGNFNVPYEQSSGLVYDGFMSLAPVFSADAPVDPEFPVTAPHVFVDGTVDMLSLSWPNALNFAHKVNDALWSADATLSRDVNDWVRLYLQRYGNHDWTGRFYEVLSGGSDDPVYYDLTKPLDSRLNTDGRGRKLNWVMTELSKYSPVYLRDLADQQKSGWGQFTSTYYQLNDGFYVQVLQNLANWAERGVEPPPSRIDPVLLAPEFDPANGMYPAYLPQNDPTQDSLNRGRSSTSSYADDLNWQRDNPGGAIAFAVDEGLVEMPHVATRTGLFYVGYKYFELRTFTCAQLVGGYNHGNVDFAGYTAKTDYLAAFAESFQRLVDDQLYDRQLAKKYSRRPVRPLRFRDCVR